MVEIGTEIRNNFGCPASTVVDVSKAGTITLSNGVKVKPDNHEGLLRRLRVHHDAHERYYVLDSPAWREWCVRAERLHQQRQIYSARVRALNQTSRAINTAVNAVDTIEAIEAITAAVVAALEVRNG